MPMFEFKCAECKSEFEALVYRVSEKEEVKCPNCGGLDLEEKISRFASGPGAGAGDCAPSGGG
jgi:putative FmdB family regulatory protein